jgi:hypothetical protein
MTGSAQQARRDVARRMADAAAAWVATLDDVQRGVAVWPFADADERGRWYYTPTDHGGLPLGAMRPGQQRLAHALVATGLSRAGYVTVATIIGLDNVLDHLEGWVTSFGRERGRDPGMYDLRVFGDPTGDAPWSWRFGGHHVSIQHVVAGGEVVGSTPCFLGADPAEAPLLGPHLLRPLGALEDLGRELARSLDEAQRAVALVSPVAPVDLVSANRPRFGEGDGDLPLPLIDVWRDRFTGDMARRVIRVQEQAEAAAGLRPEHLEAVRLGRTPRGLAAAHLRVDQRELLRALLDTYVGRIPDALADAERATYAAEADLDRLHFLWAGGLERGEGHYYRVQGPRLLAEYDNTQRDANHIHTVWRDARRDAGADPLGAHYQLAHQDDRRDRHDH